MRPADGARVRRKTRRAALKGTGRGRRSTHLVRTTVGRRRAIEERVAEALRAAAEQITPSTSGLGQIRARTTEASAVAPAEATHHQFEQ